MGQPEVYDALRARAWLMVGGQFGLHHLYMDEPLEAFVYFATAGLFLMGVLFDAFAIHSIVRRRNAMLRRAEDEEGLSEPLVACSLGRFLSQFLFGYWIGFVYGLAAMLAFTKNRRTLHSVLVGAAVCKGVYVVGNTRNQRRNLLFIWAAAFSTSFICIQILEMHILRSLLFVSLSATLLGNRGARAVPVRSRRFTYKTYLVLCAIYCAGLLVLTSGISRRVFDRRIVVVSTKHHSRISSSIGLIVYDHFWGTHPNKTIFSYDAHVEYVALGARNQQTDSDWLKPHSKSVPKKVSSASWWWDQFGGSSSDTERTLFDYLTVLTADYFRAKALARISKRNDGKFEAVQWSAWRMLAIYATEASPYISDSELLSRCEHFLRTINRSPGRSHLTSTDWKYLGVKKAYEVIRSIDQL
uniref:TM2 domain-containing protein n=1 Tax=Parascaris univalens TaxID=6257 RepID=A0A914ZPJ7_PARUN